MELVFIVLAIIFSIWSEVNKQKKEKDLDFDFSDLSSIEDFVKKDKNTSGMPEGAYQAPQNDFAANKKKGLQKSRSKGKSSGGTHSPENQSEFQHTNYDQVESRKDVNYDEMKTFTEGRSFEECLIPERGQGNAREEEARPSGLTINRDNVVHAFIMSEVMTRYNINRIYERIPGVRNDAD